MAPLIKVNIKNMNPHNKKILILVGKITEKNDKLARLISGFIDPGIEIKMDVFSNLSFDLEQGSVTVKVSGINIKNFDLVYIRSVDAGLSFLAGVLALSLDHLHIKYLDKKFINSRATTDKLTSLLILGLNDFPIIPTFFCSKEKLMENVDYIVEKFGYPVVAKELISHHSKGLFVLREEGDFQKLIENVDLKKSGQFLFQKYIPLTEEYRLLVLGSSVRSVQKMYRDLSGSKSNIDYDRKEEFIDVNQIPQKKRELEVLSAKALNLQVAGVDLLTAKKDLQTFVIEVNGTPGFTYGTDLSPEILELSRYLEEEVKL